MKMHSKPIQRQHKGYLIPKDDDAPLLPGQPPDPRSTRKLTAVRLRLEEAEDEWAFVSYYWKWTAEASLEIRMARCR